MSRALVAIQDSLLSLEGRILGDLSRQPPSPPLSHPQAHTPDTRASDGSAGEPPSRRGAPPHRAPPPEPARPRRASSASSIAAVPTQTTLQRQSARRRSASRQAHREAQLHAHRQTLERLRLERVSLESLHAEHRRLAAYSTAALSGLLRRIRERELKSEALAEATQV
tara:strand:- start:135 stop:638 length:504 start_codon:yes stop_codon:yes gene_type:complete